jgi:hypothetical protein
MQEEEEHKIFCVNSRRRREWVILSPLKYEGHLYSYLFYLDPVPGHWDPEVNTTVPAFQETTA